MQLLDLPNAVILNIWIFIPRDFLLCRCLNRYCNEQDLTSEMKYILFWEIIIPGSLIMTEPIKNMLTQDFHVSDLVPSKTCLSYRTFMNMAANRVYVLLVNQFRENDPIKLLNLLSQTNDNYSRFENLRMFCFALIHVIQPLEKITIPKLDEKAHQQLANALFLRSYHFVPTGYISRELKFISQDVTKVISFYCKSVFQWSKMELTLCCITKAELPLIIGNNPKLRYLVLNHNNVGDDSIDYILPWLRKNGKTNGTLEIRNNKLTAYSHEQFMSAVRNMESFVQFFSVVLF
jgi:hypothetical protein